MITAKTFSLVDRLIEMAETKKLYSDKKISKKEYELRMDKLRKFT